MSPTAAAERLAELDDHEQQFGLSPDGKKLKVAAEREVMQQFAEEASARAEADAQLRAAEAELQEKFARLHSELEVFVGVAEDYTATRAAYDLAASTARKRSVSFVPIDRFEVVATRNDDEGRAVRKLLKAFHAALNRRW